MHKRGQYFVFMSSFNGCSVVSCVDFGGFLCYNFNANNLGGAFMKRVLSFLLVLVLSLGLLAGCGDDSNGDTVSNGNAVNDSMFSTEDVKFVDANGESVYTFVRAESLSTDASAKAMEIFTGLKKTVGVNKMKNASDVASDGTDSYEILVGKTNRPESSQALEYLKGLNNGRSRDYIIATIGKKIVVNGFSDKAIIAAVDYFVKNYMKATLEGGLKYTYTTVGDFQNVTVNGVHLGQFKIVRPEYNVSYLAQLQVDTLINNAENNYAYALECVNDTSAQAEYEIILGAAKRDGAVALANRDEYKVNISDKKIYLNGGSPEAMAMAVSEFEKLLAKNTLTNADSIDGSYAQTLAGYDKSTTYTHSWGDDFDGTEIDTTKWVVVPDGPYNNPGMNGRRSIRTTDTDYVYAKDGFFHIDAGYTQNEYIGGMIFTYKTMVFKYGYVEMSAILPHGKGFWTALWVDSRGHNFDVSEENGIMYGSEIDVNECFGNANVIAANVHKWPTEYGTEVGYKHTSLDDAYGNEKKYSLENGQTFNDTFHTFGLIWDEDEHSFTCDGKVYFSYKNDETGEDKDGLHILSFLRLSAAIGFETQGVIEPDDSSAWSETNKLIVDYVHIYQLQNGKQLLMTK